MADSAPLAAAHRRPRARTAVPRETGPARTLWILLRRWLLTFLNSVTARAVAVEPDRPGEHASPVGAPGDRRTRMALAVAGAQRARAEERSSAADFALEWERRFDAARPADEHLAGGGAWA